MSSIQAARSPGLLRLDVVIATYNRSHLLGGAISSLLRAERPPLLELRIYVVDNNSTDSTREVAMSFGGDVEYLHESGKGKSRALNAGIASGCGDIVGIIDDDEEVHLQWLSILWEWMSRPDVDFIGGPYLPFQGLTIPGWFPPAYGGVVGISGPCASIQPFGPVDGPMLLGGNTIIRRNTLERVGLYNPQLGRTEKHLLCCEDEELYIRLLNSGAKGFYVPDLVVYHLVPPERLKRSYFRRWCFWRAVSKAFVDRLYPEDSSRILGVPKWMFGRAVRGTPAILNAWHPATAFDAELRWWDLAGWLYGTIQRTKQPGS